MAEREDYALLSLLTKDPDQKLRNIARSTLFRVGGNKQEKIPSKRKKSPQKTRTKMSRAMQQRKEHKSHVRRQASRSTSSTRVTQQKTKTEKSLPDQRRSRSHVSEDLHHGKAEGRSFMRRGSSGMGRHATFDVDEGSLDTNMYMDMSMDVGVEDRMDFMEKSTSRADGRDFSMSEFSSTCDFEHDQDDSMVELRGILSTLEKSGLGEVRAQASKSFHGFSTKKPEFPSSKRRERSVFSDDLDSFSDDWRGRFDVDEQEYDDDKYIEYSPQSHSLPKGLKMSLLDGDGGDLGKFHEKESWDSFSLPSLSKKRRSHQGMGGKDRKMHHLRTMSDSFDTIQLPSLARIDQKEKMDKLMDLTEQLYYSQTSQDRLERISDEIESDAHEGELSTLPRSPDARIKMVFSSLAKLSEREDSASHQKPRRNQSEIERLSDTLRDSLHLQPMSADLEGLSISLGGSESEEKVDHTQKDDETIKQRESDSSSSSASIELMKEIREMKNMLLKEAQARQQLEKKLIERGESGNLIREQAHVKQPHSSPHAKQDHHSAQDEATESDGHHSSEKKSTMKATTDESRVSTTGSEHGDGSHSQESVALSTMEKSGASDVPSFSAPEQPATYQRRPSILRRRASLREKRRSISFSEEAMVMKYEYRPSSRAGQLSHRKSVLLGEDDDEEEEKKQESHSPQKEKDGSQAPSKAGSGEMDVPKSESKPEQKALEEESEKDEQRALVKGLFSKARHNKTEDAEAILDKGISIDTRDSFGNTILIIAAQNGHKAMMKLCLRKKADINAQNKKGQTPLHFAFAYGYSDLGEWLLSKGADDTIRNMSGLTCYEGLGPR